MKKNYTITILLMLVFLVVLTNMVGAEELKFRGYELGTPRSVIMDNEFDLMEEGKNMLVGVDSLAGEDVAVVYLFDNNTLRTGMYLFLEFKARPIANNDKENIRTKMMEQLTQKYGEVDSSNDSDLYYSWKLNNKQSLIVMAEDSPEMFRGIRYHLGIIYSLENGSMEKFSITQPNNKSNSKL